MNKKILGLIIALLISVMLPFNLKAWLNDTYDLEEDTSVTLNAFYAVGDWGTSASSKRYLTASECSEKNGKINTNDYMRWYGYYEVTCGVDPSSNNYSSCTSPSTGRGLTEEAAKNACLLNATSIPGSVCTTDEGTSEIVKATSSNIKYGTTINGSTKINDTNYGTWSTYNPDSSLYSYVDTNESIVYACTVRTSYGQKSIVENKYKTTSGADAFCIMPGVPFKPQTYKKIDEFDVSNCKSSVSNFYCGLAATLAIAEQEYDGEYLTTLTALRLWTADQRQGGEGWWDPKNDTKYANNLYLSTAEHINIDGYGGESSTGLEHVLYGDTASTIQLQNAIKIYKTVKGGVSMDMPRVSPTSVENYNYETNSVTAYLSSSLDLSTQLIKVYSSQLGEFTYSTSKNAPNMSYTLEPISCTTDTYCYKLTLFINNEYISNNELEVSAVVSYDGPYKMINAIGYYSAVNKPSNYQYMVLFDKSKVTDSFEVPINFPIPEKPICTIVEGIPYDKDGNPTDYTTYQEECSCVKDKENNTCYLQYPDVPVDCDSPEYINTCEQVTCEVPKVDKNVPAVCGETNTTGSIEDPSICNILNRESNQNLESDYLTNYGNEYCDIYCRDELTFTFMDKETALAGQYFQHHVTSKYLKDQGQTAASYLSTVILSTRQCSSVIKYKEWKEKYDAANEEVLNTWNELKIWEAFYNLEKDEFGNSTGAPTSTKSGGSASGCNGTDAAAASKYYAYWENAAIRIADTNGMRYAAASDITKLLSTTEKNNVSVSGSGGSLSLTVRGKAGSCSISYACATCPSSGGSNNSSGGTIIIGGNGSGSVSGSGSTGSTGGGKPSRPSRPTRPTGRTSSLDFDYTISNLKLTDDYSNNVMEVATGCSCGHSSTCDGASCTDATNADLKFVEKKYTTALEAYHGAIKERDRLMYELMDCNFMNEETSVYHTQDYYTTTSEQTYKPDVSFKTYETFANDFPDPEAKITYDETEKYSDEFDIQYEIETGRIETDPIILEDKTTYSMETSWFKYCGVGGDTYDTIDVEASCNNDLSSGLSHNSYFEVSPTTYWSCAGSGTNATCRNVLNTSVYIPKNTLVNVVVDKEYGYYQKKEMYTQVYTGQVRNTPSSVGYWISLPDYIYPVGIQRVTDDYDMNVSVSYNNNRYTMKFGTSELYCGYHVVNELSKFKCDDSYHECYECVGSDECDATSTDLGIYFRTIDLNDIFPNSQYSPPTSSTSISTPRRNIGANWIPKSEGGMSNNAVQVIESIQKLGDNIYLDQPYQYKVTLTPTDIKAIQQSNKQKEPKEIGGYQDNSLINCNLTTLYCESNFLKNELKNNILKERYDDLYKVNTKGSIYYYSYSAR